VNLRGPEVDALRRAHGLLAELDGRAAHLTERAVERDRARDAHLLLHGLRVVRLTWRQVTREPAATADLLRRLLHR
jgi:very-short-patch-repair endonuclease